MNSSLRARSLPWVLAAALALPLAAVPTAPAAAAAAAPRSTPVDLNTASQKDLESLPGVGAATAKKIVAGRPYSSVADLSKAGVSKRTIDKITPLVTVGGGAAAAPAPAPTPAPKPAGRSKAAASSSPSLGVKVDLNSASQKDLEALPGVGPATAKKIIAGRPYTAVDDLSKAGLSAKQIDKFRAMVQVVPMETAAKAPATSSAPDAASTAPAPAAAKTSTAASRTAAATPAQPPPAPSMVWVNLDTKVFHREGDRWYGKTKHGQYMTEADALKAGYREAKKGGKAKSTT